MSVGLSTRSLSFSANVTISVANIGRVGPSAPKNEGSLNTDVFCLAKSCFAVFRSEHFRCDCDWDFSLLEYVGQPAASFDIDQGITPSNQCGVASFFITVLGSWSFVMLFGAFV